MEVVSVAIVIPYKLEENVLVWMQKRRSIDSLNGLLEFPGGKVEAGEDPKNTAIREVFEETGVRLDSSKLKYESTYQDHNQNKVILLNIYSYLDAGEFTDNWYGSKESYWASIPPANQIFLEDILNSLKSGC